MNCIRCQKLAGQGGNVGLGLDGIGLKYNRARLIESVLYPSRQILSGYQATVIKTRAGELESGLLRSETATDVVLVDASGQEKRIPKSQIESRGESAVSLMPEGLQVGLPLQAFNDLISYLETLR